MNRKVSLCFLLTIIPTHAIGWRKKPANEDDEMFTGVWREYASMPIKISDTVAETVENKIYITGGCSGDQNGYSCPSLNSRVVIYDPIQETFKFGASAPRPRYRHSTGVVGTKLYVVGGRDLADAVISEVDVYDTSTDTWCASHTRSFFQLAQ